MWTLTLVLSLFLLFSSLLPPNLPCSCVEKFVVSLFSTTPALTLLALYGHLLTTLLLFYNTFFLVGSGQAY